MTNTKNIIRIIYLYLFSLVGLVLIVVASVSLLDLGLKATIFRQADQYPSYPEYPMPRSAVEKPIPGATISEDITEPTAEEKAEYEKKLAEYEKENRRRERERTASRSLAMLLVGIPLFLYHWRKVQEKE